MCMGCTMKNLEIKTSMVLNNVYACGEMEEFALP